MYVYVIGLMTKIVRVRLRTTEFPVFLRIFVRLAHFFIAALQF